MFLLFLSFRLGVQYCQLGALLCEKTEVVSRMAKGKYADWLTPEGLLKIEGWARDGLTDEQIATNIGIRAATLYDWKNRFSDISEALKRGKEIVDRQVENALLKRALGYEYEEVREKYEGGVLTERTVTKKEVVADTTAQIFWLKNRKPQQWRDKPVEPIMEDAEEDGFLEALENAAEDDWEHEEGNIQISEILPTSADASELVDG